jgi:hypothetical protein
MSRLSMQKVFMPQPGWYRGDFHLHTKFSDGKYTPKELAHLAKEHGLDFFAITDHNAIGSYTEFGDPEVLVIPGIEVTFEEGHWNVFGMEDWRDWMENICVGHISIPLNPKDKSTTDLMRRISEQGLLNSINHPLLKPWEWRDGKTDLKYVNCLEIWNDPLWPDNLQANPQAVEFWSACLNAGYRITAIGGSDFHFLPGDTSRFPGERPGLPTTYVWGQALSGEAILDSIRQHKVYVSLGPQVSFQALFNGRQFQIGSDLGAVSGEVELVAEVSGDSQAKQARLVKNGKLLVETKVEGGQGELHCHEKLEADGASWYRLDIIDSQGAYLAISNPIFAGTWNTPKPAAFGDFTQDGPEE